MLLGRRRALVCREVVELVTDYLEGAMAPQEQGRFEEHLATCPHCREYLSQMRTTLHVLARIEPEELVPDARAELVALYRRWLAS